MAISGRETEEWRLGVDPGTHEVPIEGEAAESPRNYSAERLARPLAVLTAEHVGWAVVAILALATRLVMLGARPLDSAEAGRALTELELLRSGPPPGTHLSWVQLLQAAIFAFCGSGDYQARLIYALCGLLLIGICFAMRRRLGRAGALAFASLLMLSPSVAYFSRAADSLITTMALALLALAIFLELTNQPGRILAVAIGIAAGLALATGGPALMTAIFMLSALAIVGLTVAIATRRTSLQVRVWWTRRKALFAIAVVVAAVIWLGWEGGFFGRSPAGAIGGGLRSDIAGLRIPDAPSFLAGLNFYLPLLALYEFLIVLLAIVGALAVLTLRIRSRLATGALIWSILAVAFYLWSPVRSPDFVLQMLVPMALLGALLVEALHHTAAWNFIRYPLTLLVLFTLYLQVANNFIRYAPDASEAPWARTALLFWSAPATTSQAPFECARIAAEMPPSGPTAYFVSSSPVLRWYLRGAAPAMSQDHAAAIVGSNDPASLFEAQGLTTHEFELDDRWEPDWQKLTPKSALNYLVNSHAWTPLESRRVTVAVRPVLKTAPTVILAPAMPVPSASPSPAAESGTIPQSGSSAEASASPAASTSATPASTTSPQAGASAAPAAESTMTPAPSPSTIPGSFSTPAASATPNAAAADHESDTGDTEPTSAARRHRKLSNPGYLPTPAASGGE
jgi:uncharacterized protein (TIGR03663 family)